MNNDFDQIREALIESGHSELLSVLYKIEREHQDEKAQHKDTRDKLDQAIVSRSRMSALGLRAAHILGDSQMWPRFEAICGVPATEPGGYGHGFETAMAQWDAWVRVRAGVLPWPDVKK